jgi:hypothetical protein
VPQALLESLRVEILKTSLTGEPCRETPGCVRVAGEQTLVATADEWLELRRFRPQPAPADTSARIARGATTEAG